jgi:eukaryotic-like serine/threonine-protein kinase
MDECQWTRLTDLFERLLEAADPEAVLAAEPEFEVRAAALPLWQHHMRANEEKYLEVPVEFQVTPVFREGQVLLNRFRIEKQLGSGGMGEVYLAWDGRIEDYVAIKTIARLLAHSPSIRRRFVAEAQNARRVTHPNVCRIHELFEDGETAFFSMEYVNGVLLSDSGPLGTAHARSIVLQTAGALCAAHRIGVVHGDFKPANVILAPAVSAEAPPRAVIMDFGLARAVDRADTHSSDALSMQAGTADYMAPELRDGATPSMRSDIYAFGQVASRLLPRERFWNACVATLPKDRPATLDPIIEHLESDASRRYWILGSISAVAAAAGNGVWASRRSTTLPANARILVNGFRAIAAQLPGARLIRSLLLTALQQSPRIHAIADQDMAPALRRLQLRGTLPLTGRPLAELIAKLGAKFWIEGDLREGAGRYSLDLRLLSIEQESAVATTALRDAMSLIALARSAALWVRQISGESERSFETYPVDVGKYMSEVPEALQKYYEGGDYYSSGAMAQAIPLLQEAVQLDPQFAQAHNLLALTLNSVRRDEEGFRELQIAMDLGRRLPERERLNIETNYYRMTEDPVQMTDAARRCIAIRPDEARSHSMLANTLLMAGRAAEAADSFRNALALVPDDWMYVLRLENSLVEAGRAEKAIADFEMRPHPDSADNTAPDRNWIYNAAAYAYLAMGKYEDAYQYFLKEPHDPENAANRQSARILQGRLEEAEAAMRIALSEAENEVRGASAGKVALQTFEADQFLCGLYFVLNRPAEALSRVRQMADLPAYPYIGRNLACTASWARRLQDGETLSRVRATASIIAQRWDNAFTRGIAAHIEGLERWRRGAFDEAERLFLESIGAAYNIWARFDLAELYTSRGQWQLAEGAWDNFESCQGTVFVKRWFPGILILGWLQRAVAARGSNQRERAFRYSQKVLDHWAHSNPGLPLVEAAREVHRTTKPF